MQNINSVLIEGNLSRDPELRTTPQGKSVCSFSIAVNEYGEEVGFFDFEAWGQTAEAIKKYCLKGDRVFVEGSLRQNRWQDDEGVKHSRVRVLVRRIHFRQPKPAGQHDERPATVGPTGEDDIPF